MQFSFGCEVFLICRYFYINRYDDLFFSLFGAVLVYCTVTVADKDYAKGVEAILKCTIKTAQRRCAPVPCIHYMYEIDQALYLYRKVTIWPLVVVPQ